MPQKKQLPPYEIYLILSYLLKKSREYLYTHPEIRLNKAQKARFDRLVKRRINHEPLSYLVRHKEFYGLDFRVNKNTLIPRPETELLVEEVISNAKLAIRKNVKAEIIDIGTGSGNIIISIAKELEQSKLPITNYKLLATDISSKALGIAKYNAKKHNVDKKIKFFKSDLLKNKKLINHLTIKPFNNLIIVANLPYLSEKIYSSTAPDVKNYEPKSALLSGPDGLDHYEKMFKQLKQIFVHCPLFTVHCFLEISPEQKNKLQKLARKYFPKAKMGFKKDLAGKWRIAIVEM